MLISYVHDTHDYCEQDWSKMQWVMRVTHASKFSIQKYNKNQPYSIQDHRQYQQNDEFFKFVVGSQHTHVEEGKVTKK